MVSISSLFHVNSASKTGVVRTISTSDIVVPQNHTYSGCEANRKRARQGEVLECCGSVIITKVLSRQEPESHGVVE